MASSVGSIIAGRNVGELRCDHFRDISKQAAHKLAHAAITTLREKLESMGFPAIDTIAS